MHTGDFILLYSDCMVDSCDANEEPYGIKRICEAISRADASKTAEDILQTLIYDFLNFTGTDKLDDDLTVILLKKL